MTSFCVNFLKNDNSSDDVIGNHFQNRNKKGKGAVKLRKLLTYLTCNFSSIQILSMNSSSILWCDEFTYFIDIIKKKLKMK